MTKKDRTESSPIVDEFDDFDELDGAHSHGTCACGDKAAMPPEEPAQSCGMQSTEATAAEAEPTDGERDDLLEEEMEELAERLSPLLAKLAPMAGRAVAGNWILDDDGESELENADSERDSGSDDLDGLKAEEEALAQELAAEAAETEDDQEAEYLAGGVVVQIFSPAPVVIKRVVPALVHRSVRLVRLLRRWPRTRRFLRVLPVIQARTMATLSRAASRGSPITGRRAIRTLGRHTVRIFRSPRRVVWALRRNSARRRWLNRRAIARSEL